MRAHVFQHAPFEGIGNIQRWLDARNAEVTYSRLFESPQLPDLSGIDLLIVMGGPMGANDEAGFPWLADEKRFIAGAIAADVPVLGICLGGQLVAAALGARVYRGPQKEIGWFDVTATERAGDVFPFPEHALAFHWHADAFEVPEGGIRLATSEACRNQAFQFGRRTIALQCHFEMTPEVVDALLDVFGDELMPEAFVQSAAQLRHQPAEVWEGIATHMDAILEYLTA